MSSNNTKRIRVDLADVQKCNRENDCGISVVVGDDLLGFDAFIKGPAGTPYEGGTFKVRINIPAEYPMQPPVATFKTEIWHPNISSVSGYVCLDTLGSKWVGCMNFRAVLLSLQNLLINPEPADPQDAVVGGQAQRDLSMFRGTAEMWTHIFAGGRKFKESLKRHVKSMTDMGYNLNNVMEHLSAADWDIDMALETINMNT